MARQKPRRASRSTNLQCASTRIRGCAPTIAASPTCPAIVSGSDRAVSLLASCTRGRGLRGANQRRAPSSRALCSRRGMPVA
eukprot:6351060-Prymnesium_polylepis.1